MKKQKRLPLAKKYFVRNVLILLLSLVVLVAGSGCIYVDGLLGHGNFINDQTIVSTPITPSTIDSGTSYNSNGANQVNGMLTDEAITNILLVGLDDYQKDDPIGRSDSMMLISVDNRHKKLKLSSFMRDIYLAIPNNGSNKLNAAYHFGAYHAIQEGKAKAGDLTSINTGMQLCIQTIELNFGMKVDRYIAVRDSAFDAIVDTLGGVDLQITAKEAQFINRYSGSNSKLEEKDSTQHLNGAQVHYYGRIRDDRVKNIYGHIDDEGRAERQRLAITSAVNKLKSSNLPMISQLASNVLPKVITNFSRNEIYNLLTQALTILKYPITQNQIPAAGNYTTPYIKIGGEDSAIVQITDNRKVVESALTFIYEQDKPDVSHIGLAAAENTPDSTQTEQSDPSIGDSDGN